MRITRSTLRRIIAEESARILAETKKGTHERVPGGHQMRMAAGFEDEPEEEDWDDDYYGDPDPFGDDEALEKGYEYDSATAGWKKPAEDETAEDDYYGDDDPFGDDEALEMGYEYDPSSAGWKKPGLDEGSERRDDTECLYILKRGGQHVYIVAPPYLESAAELDELGHDITDQIMSGGPAVRDANVYEFLGSNPQVAVVRVRGAYEMAEDYMMSLEDNLGATTGPVYESEEELDEDDALDEGDPSYRDPGDDAGYAADLQRDLGAFTSPENIPGTMQYRDRERAAYYEKSGAPRNTSDYAEYDHLREDDERDLSRPSNFLEEGEGGDYDYGYEDEPEAEMGDPEDPYGDLPKGERPRGGLVHTAGFKGGSPAGALLRRRGGEDLSEARWAKIAGILKG